MNRANQQSVVIKRKKRKHRRVEYKRKVLLRSIETSHPDKYQTNTKTIYYNIHIATKKTINYELVCCVT
jgi:hypothetical protein